MFGEIQNQRKTRQAGRSHEISDPKTINSPSISLRKIALDNQLPVSRTHEGKRLRRFRVRRFHEGNGVTRFRVVRAEGTDHDPAEVRPDTKISKQKYLQDPVNGVRTRSVKVMRPSEPWDRTPWFFLDCEQNPRHPGRLANTYSTSELWSVKGLERTEAV